MGNLPQNQSYGNQGDPFAVGSTFKVPKIQLPSAPSGATLGSRLGVSPNTPALPWRSLDPTLASKENSLQTYTYNAGVPTEQPAFPSVDQNGNPIGTNTPIPIPSDYSGFVPAGGYNNPQDGTSGSWATPVSPVIKNFPGDVQGQYVQDTANPNALIKSQRGTNLSENKFILNGRPSALNQIDHIMPLELGGADTMANREILTFEQNQQKTVAQAVPYTLYAHGQISLTEARLMATQWKDRDIGGLNHPDNVGLIPLKQAEDAAYRWTQPAQPTFKDIMAGIPQATKDLGKGYLPDPVREFIKGFGSGATMGFLPYEQGENEDTFSKIAGYGGMLAGGIGSFILGGAILDGVLGIGSAGLRVVGALRGTAESAAAAEGLVSGEVAATQAAPGLGTRLLNAVRGVKAAAEPVIAAVPDTAPNYIYKGFVSPLTKGTVQGALKFGGTNVIVGQMQQYVQNHLSPDILSGKRQATTEQNLIPKLFSDMAIGTIAGVASPTLRGAGLAMAPVLALNFVEDPHHPMNALTSAVVFGAFHLAGSGAKKADIENLKQSFTDTQQNPDFQAFKANVLDRPHYNTLSYYAPELYPDLKPGDPIPTTAYEPATVKVAASKAKAALDIRRTFDINPDGTDAGVGMSDQAYNQELARIITASDQMSVGGLSPELQEQANVNNIISFAKSLKSKGKGPNGENLGSRFDQLQDIWTPRVTQNIAKYVSENKVALAPTEAPAASAGAGSKFLTGDMAGTGLGIKRNTEVGAQFFRQEPGWDTLPVVTAHLRPELEGVFRLGNDVTAKNPTLAKGRAPDPNPQNAIQLFGYKQNQSTGQLKSYALSYVAGDGRLNTDPLAINKETKTWTNPPPDIAINKDQLATAMDENGVHILQLNVDWGRSTDSTVKSKNPFGVYTVSDKNWQDSIAMRDKLAADNVPNPYSQNIAQIRNSQNAKTVSAAIKNVSDKVVTDITAPASPQELKANLARPTIDLVQTPEETAATFKMKDDPIVKQGLQTIAMAENSGSGKAVMKAKVQFTKILKEKMAENPDPTTINATKIIPESAPVSDTQSAVQTPIAPDVAKTSDAIVAKARELLPSIKSLESQTPVAGSPDAYSAKLTPNNDRATTIANDYLPEGKTAIENAELPGAGYTYGGADETSLPKGVTRAGKNWYRKDFSSGDTQWIKEIKPTDPTAPYAKVHNQEITRMESRIQTDLQARGEDPATIADVKKQVRTAMENHSEFILGKSHEMNPDLALPKPKFVAKEFYKSIDDGLANTDNPATNHFYKTLDTVLSTVEGPNYRKNPLLPKILADYFRDIASSEVNSEGRGIEQTKDIINAMGSGNRGDLKTAYEARNKQNAVVRSQQALEQETGRKGLSPSELAARGVDYESGDLNDSVVRPQHQDENMVHDLTKGENLMGALFSDAPQGAATSVRAARTLALGIGGKDPTIGLRDFILARDPSARRTSIPFDRLEQEAIAADASHAIKTAIKDPSAEAKIEVPALEKKASAITKALEHGPDTSLEQALEDVKAKIQKYSSLIEETNPSPAKVISKLDKNFKDVYDEKHEAVTGSHIAQMIHELPSSADGAPSWIPESIKQHPNFSNYLQEAKRLIHRPLEDRSVPQGSTPKDKAVRSVFNILMDELDKRSDVNSGSIRRQITKLYDNGVN